MGRDNHKDFLHRQLIRLGDMMGDGLHHEPDGKWIEREYAQTAKALGYGPPRKNNSVAINERMKTRVTEVKCQKSGCGGELKQTRSGSKRGICSKCSAKYQLMK